MSNPASIAAANSTSEFQPMPLDAQALSDATFQAPADPITVADQGATGAIVDAILGATPGLPIDYHSIVIVGGPTSVGYYDGSLSPLGIGAGLLITSGTMPGTSNTVGWFGIDNGMNGDAALDAVINPIFATNSYDATSITFDFTVTDPSITGISFNIVFGTDEYPEWVDQFVDIAVVLVNGVNVAYFGNDPNAPLSVISQNLAAGYFIDNGSGNLPIEYDGVSNVLTVFAPVTLGVNTITIAIADTGDHIYDSGLFISGLQGVTLPATGVSQDIPCTEGNDDVVGTGSSESLNGLGGDDSLNGGGGDDVIQGGAGSDDILGGSGHDVLDGGQGHDLVDGGNGADMVDYRAAAGAVTLDLNTGIHTGEAAGDTFTAVERWLLSNASDSFFGSAAAEQVDGYDGDDALDGGDGNDSLRGLNGADTINGDGGNDTLQGGVGNDVINGGDGFDKIYGDAGNDTLTGGADAGDQFIWSANANLGSDHITDFQDGLDMIRLVGTGATQFSDLLIGTNGSGWATITLANGTVITLDGVLASAVDASDFLWG